MESSFTYSKFVTGRFFIGRQRETTILANLLGQGENVVLYEPSKTGKTSVVQQAFFNMRTSSHRFNTVSLSLLNVRTVSDFCISLGSAVIKASGTSPSDYSEFTMRYLEGTHFVFDEQMFFNTGKVLSLNWDIDDDDITAILRLPYRISASMGMPTYVLIDDFQNIMLTDDGERLCLLMEQVFKSRTAGDRAAASYILCGSQVNAMKYIFETRHFLYHQFERVKLEDIETKDIIDHIVKTFLSSGKVIDRDLLIGVCNLFRNNIWYISYFSSICDSLSKGYIMEPVLLEALDSLISVFEPRFLAIMNDLTTFQVDFLKAVVDGNIKFSSAEVIKHYKLNSSANVRRIKDALCKKEILLFDDVDTPSIIDPLFEYWVKKYYFELNV